MNNKRELGYWETTCKYGHDMFAGSGNVVAMVEIKEEPHVETLIKALSYLYQRHPALQATLYDQSHHYYFNYSQALTTLPFQVYNHTHWQTVVEKEMQEKFNVSVALWRACLNKQFDRYQLIFATHHGAADGLSLIFLLQEWLSLYHQLANNKTVNITTLPYLAAIEDLLVQKNNWQNFIKNRQKYHPDGLKPWPFQKLAPLAERQTRIIYQTLDAELLAGLKTQCKQNNVTINSALNSALLFAIQCNLSDPLHTTLHTPINLRRYTTLPISNEHIGCFISMVMTEHQLTAADDFWSLAKAYQTQLHERIPELGFCPSEFSVANFDLAELMLLFDMVASSKRKNFSCGFGVSNLGQIQFNILPPSLNPTKLMFCTNRVVGDFVIFLNVLGFEDMLHLGFCYPEPLVEKTWVTKVIDDFKLLFKASIRNLPRMPILI